MGKAIKYITQELAVTMFSQHKEKASVVKEWSLPFRLKILLFKAKVTMLLSNTTHIKIAPGFKYFVS